MVRIDDVWSRWRVWSLGARWHSGTELSVRTAQKKSDACIFVKPCRLGALEAHYVVTKCSCDHRTNEVLWGRNILRDCSFAILAILRGRLDGLGAENWPEDSSIE